MNAIRESRFLWMLFASHVFYGSVRNSADLLMTVVFMSSAKGVAICDGVCPPRPHVCKGCQLK